MVIGPPAGDPLLIPLWHALGELYRSRLEHPPRAIQAFEKLMGLVLTAIAVEMLLNGVRTFAARLPG